MPIFLGIGLSFFLLFTTDICFVKLTSTSSTGSTGDGIMGTGSLRSENRGLDLACVDAGATSIGFFLQAIIRRRTLAALSILCPAAPATSASCKAFSRSVGKSLSAVSQICSRLTGGDPLDSAHRTEAHLGVKARVALVDVHKVKMLLVFRVNWAMGD